MSYSERTNSKQYDSYGGWTMTWQRMIEGRWYKFTRSYISGTLPVVNIEAYRYDNKGSWIQVHAYQYMLAA